MPVSVELTDEGIGVRLTGMDMVWAVRGSVTVPWSDVAGARVVDAQTARSRLLLRLGGTGLTGVVKAGRYTVRGEPGVREFWSTYRDPELLEIETRQERPKRIVLQVPDRAELAAAINARVAGSS